MTDTVNCNWLDRLKDMELDALRGVNDKYRGRRRSLSARANSISDFAKARKVQGPPEEVPSLKQLDALKANIRTVLSPT